MPPVFVFAEQVRKVIRLGKKKIDIPQNARISAAALELINDHKIEVHCTPDKITTVNERAESRVVSADIGSEQNRPSPAGPEKMASSAKHDEPSKEVVEDIVNRVIERFYQLKGIKTTESEFGEGIPVEKDRDLKQNDGLVICRCEEITKDEIRDAIKNGIHTLNGIKRVTRAGMGLCQGETCQRLVTQILAQELDLKPADIEPTTARGPVRPIRLAVFANS